MNKILKSCHPIDVDRLHVKSELITRGLLEICMPNIETLDEKGDVYNSAPDIKRNLGLNYQTQKPYELQLTKNQAKNVKFMVEDHKKLLEV